MYVIYSKVTLKIPKLPFNVVTRADLSLVFIAEFIIKTRSWLVTWYQNV